MGEETAFREFAARLTDADDSTRDTAARELLVRYATQLVALARHRMSRRLQAKVAPEDVLQSVLRTFFRRLDAGNVELRSWGSLWGFLALMTLRKCQSNALRYSTAKRDAAREVSLQVSARDPQSQWEFLIPDRAPTPDEAAAFVDELSLLLSCLDQRDREAVELILSGESTASVAARLSCSERTVRRTLELVRRQLTNRWATPP